MKISYEGIIGVMSLVLAKDVDIFQAESAVLHLCIQLMKAWL